MTKQSETTQKAAKPVIVELTDDRLDVAAGTNALFRYYGDINGDGAPPPPRIKQG